MQNDNHKITDFNSDFEQRFNSLHVAFETSEPALIIDRNGTILDANKAFAAAFGKRPEECLQTNAFDLLPPKVARERRKKVDEALNTGKLVIFEDERRDRFVRLSLSPIANKDGKMTKLYVVIQDITQLKLTERESINQKIFNSALIESIPGAVYMVNAKGHYTFWNAYQRDVVVGKPDNEMGTFNALDTIHPDHRELVAKRMENILIHGVEDSDDVKILLHGGPEFRWFRISGKKVIINGEAFIVGIGSDITERKKAEENALKNSEDRFRKLFEGHSSVMLVIDEIGNIIDANPSAAEFYGWSIERLCQMHINNITTKSPEKVMSDLLKFRTSKLNRFQIHHKRADGSTRDVEVVSNTIDIEGKIVFYCTINDIAELKLAENQLKKLSAAVEQSPAVVVITDPQGDIEYVNPMFTQLSGYSAEEVRGKNPRILQSGLLQIEVYKDLWKTILSGRIWRGEFQNRKKNGELFWETAVISAILNDEGVVTNFVAVKEDITEQKQYLNELIAAKEKAEESDRLKSAFLANISHEIRTPMNGILGFSELLKEPHLSGKKQSGYIDLIQQSGERMLNLINDLIDISRIEAGETILQLSETPVNKLLYDLNDFFKPDADKKGLHLTFSTGLPDNNSIIETDSGKLSQILTNLVQNSLKFTSSGGIDVGYTRKDRFLEFYVIDSGIGIPVEMKAKIFDRFHQVDNSLTRHHEGSGLGLSISEAYVAMLGGTIRVESVAGRGSAFFFTLPYNPTTNSSNIKPRSHVTKEIAASNPDLTILIAEDDKVCSLVLKMYLKGDNITILSAVNGKEAVELVKKHPEINIVLMDIKMPVMNGFEATRQIKKLRPELPVIAQTAFTSKEDREKAEKAGCDCVILKPINKNELLELIPELLYR